ncbi:MAG: DUF2862 domain-containing protein [Okeania sp. SIO2F4]|uniref:cytochrome b6f subunit PetP n=1 Tax=Microcoleaceae TaxID=1892252 RepID=UPI00142CBC0C|nr:DUF2862 domain-containing protein [Okeania sp. SIO2F4]MDJ0515472.1 DUF2862 domain-containing protein [Trichodesmium sp. MO_231.B1]NES01491.1 DUF2862 domain-containing protein [Okeania sp. SIO2F4]
MEIGQKVKVKGIKQKIPGNIINRLKQNPIGTITEFKMVDGSGIGYWVQFEEKMGTWFFEDEIEAIS